MLKRAEVRDASALDVSWPWFRSVRLMVWLCQLALLVWAQWGLGIALKTGWLLALMGSGFALDFVAQWLGRRRGVGENALLALMSVDALLHTGVFALSGGPFNPFTALYLVNVVLAALVLSRPRQWLQLAVSLMGFASLFLVARVAPVEWNLPNHQQLMRLHLGGMWLAFVVAAAFIVYFVQRVLAALEAQQRQLAQARLVSSRNEKLAALTTLAAGAAHELATPLGTIAVVSCELERAMGKLEVPASLREDVQLVREQVARCRDILAGMSARSGEVAGEGPSTFAVDEWLSASTEGLRDVGRVSVRSGEGGSVVGPRVALVQALRNLIKNALEASTARVEVEVQHVERELRVQVRDAGPGLAPEELARLGEPFFTTKPVGRGMGLGVFLVRSLAMQLGGSLEYASMKGHGTTATLSLPEPTP